MTVSKTTIPVDLFVTDRATPHRVEVAVAGPYRGSDWLIDRARQQAHIEPAQFRRGEVVDD